MDPATYWMIIQTGIMGVGLINSLYNDRTTRAAAEARRQASLEYSNTVREGDISPRTVQIPSNAFNAGIAFTSLFAATAIIGVVLEAKKAEDLKKIGVHLGEIRDEIRVQTAAMVQGWQNEGFGAFIYGFLKTEIGENGGEASIERHRFYVYNSTTSADVVFKQRVVDQPLPSSFGGYSSDIEAIFRLMWANRQTLREEMGIDAADAVVFHLLVPAKGSMGVLDRMSIHPSIGRLIIKGHMDEGSCYAWFNFVRLPQQVTLHDIGRLNSDAEMPKSVKAAVAGYFGCWACVAGEAASAIFFQPAVPFFQAGALTCWSVAMAGGTVGVGIATLVGTRPPRVLGPPTDETEPPDEPRQPHRP